MIWWCVELAASAQGPVINEVVPGGNGGPDWIEVYNPGSRPVDLLAYTLVTVGRAHRIDASLVLKPHDHLVLWCDRHPEEGPDHLDLKLPREGGSLLLIDPDRKTMRDFYSWKALGVGVSLGRLQDGGRDWGYFTEPTPGASNELAKGARRILSTPLPTIDQGAVSCVTEEGSTLRYTLDGRIPQPSSPEFAGPLILPPSSVITVRAFAEDAISSLPGTLTIPAEGTAAFIAIRIDPDSLYDRKRGIFTGEDAANYARTGKDWQRAAQVRWCDGDSVRAEDVRIAVAGSGTRGLAKKNMKLFGDQETMLRADATPHAFLRNLFLERISRNGAQVDVQPSTPRPLYINGRYEGLYRAMPAKNSAWLRRSSGAESLDLIDGPGAHALKGDDDQHARLLAQLERGAPLDSLSALMEVTSLLDLACFDLYSGRADHDLNTRCWRPRVSGGRWRWILFDVDLWAPPDERTVERMCSSTAPEAPYLPWLLKHEELRPRLLARMSAWLATSLSWDRAAALADSLYATHAVLMNEDHERWRDLLVMPSPQESITSLRTHIAERPALLLEQLSDFTGRPLRKLTVRVVPPQAGQVFVEQLRLTDAERSFTAFADVPMRLTASPSPGHEFVGWQGTDEKATTILVEPGRTKALRAVFRSAITPP